MLVLSAGCHLCVCRIRHPCCACPDPTAQHPLPPVSLAASLLTPMASVGQRAPPFCALCKCLRVPGRYSPRALHCPHPRRPCLCVVRWNPSARFLCQALALEIADASVIRSAFRRPSVREGGVGVKGVLGLKPCLPRPAGGTLVRRDLGATYHHRRRDALCPYGSNVVALSGSVFGRVAHVELLFASTVLTCR